ncbi:MAG: methyltransferase domain-containing protein [Pseudomonadales bacterium]
MLSRADAQFSALQQWYAGSVGQNIWRAEKALLDRHLPHLFGYHLMTLGVCPSLPLVEASPIHHCFSLSEAASASPNIAARCHAYALPIENESVDVAVLHHSLDYSDTPHQLLRETARVLMPYGSVLIFGFQRCSTLGVQHALQKRWSPLNTVAAHNSLSVHRLHDWLTLLNFEIVESTHTVYVPPQLGEAARSHLQWLERWGSKSKLPWGSVYCVLARKTVVGVRPLLLEKEKRSLNPLSALSPVPVTPTVRPSTVSPSAAVNPKNNV